MGSCTSVAVVPSTDAASAVPAAHSPLSSPLSGPRIAFPPSRPESYDDDASPPDGRRPSAGGSSNESNGASNPERTESDCTVPLRANRPNITLKFRIPRTPLNPTVSKYSLTARGYSPTNHCDSCAEQRGLSGRYSRRSIPAVLPRTL
jgi:hypothetical protein